MRKRPSTVETTRRGPYRDRRRPWVREGPLRSVRRKQLAPPTCGTRTLSPTVSWHPLRGVRGRVRSARRRRPRSSRGGRPRRRRLRAAFPTDFGRRRRRLVALPSLAGSSSSARRRRPLACRKGGERSRLRRPRKQARARAPSSARPPRASKARTWRTFGNSSSSCSSRQSKESRP